MQAPKFYEDAPPAPPGLEWWQYKADVPPLPDPAKYFHNSSYARFGWRFDPNFQVRFPPCFFPLSCGAHGA